MRILLLILYATGSFYVTTAVADAHNPFSYDFMIGYERSALDGLSLGDDASEDRLVEEEIEFEFALEYRVTNDFYLFLTAALNDDSETIETAGIEDDVSGIERREIGFGYFFGENLVSHLRVGRTEFVSASEWWLWWDEELDAIRLESSYSDFEATLALAEEQARESTGDDFIDPEFDGVRRFLLEFAWEFADGHSLLLHYIDQNDNSSSYNLGEFEDDDRIDEEDADLEWLGIGYQGEFELDSVGNLQLELHAAEVRGDETVYEFDDPSAGRAEVTEKTERRVSGDAYGMLLSWTPAILQDWTLVLGRAVGSGDSNPDDSRIESFRQSGLQGDSETL
ncbi:MAG: alginate export family protein, partial [Gammaproteobacteria bacterium]